MKRKIVDWSIFRLFCVWSIRALSNDKNVCVIIYRSEGFLIGQISFHSCLIKSNVMDQSIFMLWRHLNMTKNECIAQRLYYVNSFSFTCSFRIIKDGSTNPHVMTSFEYYLKRMYRAAPSQYTVLPFINTPRHSAFE